MFYFDIDISRLIAIAQQSGDEIMKIYAQDFSVEIKGDNSPLTEADKKSNAVILEGLQSAYPSIPFISEENKLTPYEERKHWNRFWLIDPLDGTKEFIKKNGEFTVNIALIEEGVPVIGIVHVPAQNVTYYGAKSLGSYKCQLRTSNTEHRMPISENETSAFDIRYSTFDIKSNSHYSNKEKVTVVASRSHLSEETLHFVEELKAQGKEVDFLSSGSSLKFCLVAEGAADVYPRFGPTMEWDTAAAHAVALYAGRQVNNWETRQPLQYNKENLLNPWFIVE